MPKREVRFGVSDGTYRSATWKCWSPTGKKTDIYIVNRGIAKTLKVSLHETGQCHIAYFDSFMNSSGLSVDPRVKDRYIDKWLSPKAFANGLIIGLRIVVTHAAVCTPLKAEDSRKIKWIENCAPDKSTEIDILITPPDYKSQDWPGKNSMGNRLIDSYLLADESRVWITHHEIDPPDIKKQKINFKFFKGHDKYSLVNGKLKLMLLGDEPDGSKTLYDCALVFETKKKAFLHYLKELNGRGSQAGRHSLPRGKFFDMFR